MAKITITELARTLAITHELSQQEAERIVASFVDVANHALHYEKQLKVKGLGTFKVIDTKDRESVNVNTGERIVIEGRGKISFTPDATMRDLVNKPFSQFETVVLNDGVNFSDIDEKLSEVSDEETLSVDNVMAVKEEQVSAIEESVAPPESQENVTEGTEVISEAPVLQGEAPVVQGEEPVVSDEAPEATGEAPLLANQEPELNPSKEQPQTRKCWKRCLLATGCSFLALLLIGGGTYAGYRLGIMNGEQEIAQLKTAMTQLADSIRVKDSLLTARQVVANSEVQDTTVADSLLKVEAEQREDSLRRMAEQAKASELAAKAEEEKKRQEEYDRYAENNPQVKFGAYRIVGLDQTITVKKGQTLSSISKAFFGPDMECYVQAYNDGITEVKEGMRIKIPKLQIKKRSSNKK